MFTRTTIIAGLATAVALGTTASPALAHVAESSSVTPIERSAPVLRDHPAPLPPGIMLRRSLPPHGVGQSAAQTQVLRPDDRADRGIPATKIVTQPQVEASSSSTFGITDMAVIGAVILAALAAMWVATRRVGGERFAQ
jgi:hypothetical protein